MFLDAAPPFFMDDDARTHFGERRTLVKNLSTSRHETHFLPFYHPLASRFIDELDRAGVFGLLEPKVQHYTRNWFEEQYQPRATLFESVATPFPLETVDFNIGGAYSQYNWEIFVHIPLLISSRLMTNKHFQEAQKWLQTVFDPTQRDGLAPERYWRTPALDQSADASLQSQLKRQLDPARDSIEPSALEQQVEVWQRDPFNPFAVARLRPSAFQKAVVMAYLDNIIAWADDMARQSSAESASQATELYSQALLILGERPEVPPPTGDDAPTFANAQPARHVWRAAGSD
jgi:hypothetical protein